MIDKGLWVNTKGHLFFPNVGGIMINVFTKGASSIGAIQKLEPQVISEVYFLSYQSRIKSSTQSICSTKYALDR